MNRRASEDQIFVSGLSKQPRRNIHAAQLVAGGELLQVLVEAGLSSGTLHSSPGEKTTSLPLGHGLFDSHVAGGLR